MPHRRTLVPGRAVAGRARVLGRQCGGRHGPVAGVREAFGLGQRPEACRSVIYTFLGPEGTFTEAALLQVPGAAQAIRIPSSNVNSALDKVRGGSADAAM